MTFDGGTDQLHYEHRLADASATEHGSLAAFDERCEEVDDFDPGVENFETGAQPVDGWRRRMDRPEFGIRRKRWSAICGLAGRIEEPSEHSGPDRHPDGRPCGARLGATG